MHVRPQTEILGMSVWVPPELVQDAPLELAVMLNDRLLDRRIFFEGGKKSGYYVVPDIMRSQHVEVKFQANKTYNPFRLGFTRDATRNREQSAAIGDIRFLRIMPFQGLGFLPPGGADELLRKQCRDMPDGFRWTGRRATINIEQEIPKGAELVLCCLHPDIEKQPVSVEIEIDGKRSQAIDFTSHAAQTIAAPEALVAGARGLTLTASRTWNPRIEKITDDDRDLGIALAVRPY
ncbi:MAG: hypothetical protein JW884_08825 [Deltaproteobacteria bacterium]|nr:hypothetical protein [Deltaproteobacteria bacterium]